MRFFSIFKSMSVKKCWLKRNELVVLLFLYIHVLCITNVVEGESESSSGTSILDNSLGLDTLTVNATFGNTAEFVPKSEKKLTWISQVLSEKLSNFRPTSKTSELCNQQSDLYERSLQNLTLWAVQMKEASAGSTSGMLVGQQFHTGHFDECIRIQNPSVSGRYCLVNIKFAPSPQLYADFYTGESDGENNSPYLTAWDAFKKPKNTVHYARNDIYWGVCVPAACSGRDVEESLRESFADVQEKNGILLDLKMYEHLCSSSIDDGPLPLATKATIYILISLSALCILATLYHFLTWDLPNMEERGGLIHKVMISLSMSTNLGMLTRKTGKNNMNVLDTLKVFSILAELVGHRFIILLEWMVFNPHFYESEMTDDRLFFMGTMSVETFFIVSGFLTFFICYSPLQKHGVKIFPLMILKRWLRLMPAYLTFVVFYVFLLPYMSTGPAWNYVKNSAKGCQKEWLLTALGVNNIFMPLKDIKETPGALHTWYISCDLQLFPIGLLLVYMFTRSHTVGLKFAFTTLALATVVPFSVVYFNNYDAVFRADRSYPDGPNNAHLLNVYTQIYVRAGPYIISIISAFLLLKIRENKWTLSVPSRYLVLLAATGVSVGSQFYGQVFYDKTREDNPLEHALFIALHRSLWSLMICALIVIQLAWGFGRGVDRLLTHEIFGPLSRLTYIVYLFHFIWLIVTMASSPTPVFLSIWQIIWILAGDILVSFGAALWLYLIIEGPSSHLITALMRKITGTGQSERLQVSKKEE